MCISWTNWQKLLNWNALHWTAPGAYIRIHTPALHIWTICQWSTWEYTPQPQHCTFKQSVNEVYKKTHPCTWQKHSHEAEWTLVSEVHGGACACADNRSTLPPNLFPGCLPCTSPRCPGGLWRSKPISWMLKYCTLLALWYHTFIMRPCTSFKLVPFLFPDAILWHFGDLVPDLPFSRFP